VAGHGRLDVMVACAGVATVKPLAQMPLAEWREVLSVDLDGVFLCTKYAGIAMAGNGGGSIINIASIKAFGGAPATGHYGAAKAGVVSLTKTAALEFRAHGVRVNAICPGWIATDMVTDHKAELEAALDLSFDDYIAHIQGRLGDPDEVAGLAVFLASERSRFSSGSAYVVDGGATASLV
jgi:NAD(P)-dependent dehydrogenase (short-subunit alcohol dehydrogenase family)